jgi:hypothetical protein
VGVGIPIAVCCILIGAGTMWRRRRNKKILGKQAPGNDQERQVHTYLNSEFDAVETAKVLTQASPEELDGVETMRSELNARPSLRSPVELHGGNHDGTTRGGDNGDIGGTSHEV